MSLVVIKEKDRVKYQALSTDITSGSIGGATWIGAEVYLSDTGKKYVVLPSLQLSEITSNIHIGEVSGKMTRSSVEFTNVSGSQTAYSVYDAVSSGSEVTPHELTNVFRVEGGSGYIVGLSVGTNKSSIIPQFRVHFYNANNPILVADNLPFKDSYSDIGKLLGSYDLPSLTSSSNISGSFSGSFDGTMRYPIIAAANSTSLWIALETLSAFTPAAVSQKYTTTVIIDNN